MIDLSNLQLHLVESESFTEISLDVDYYIQDTRSAPSDDEKHAAIVDFLSKNVEIPIRGLMQIAELDPSGPEHFFEEIFYPTLGSIMLIAPIGAKSKDYKIITQLNQIGMPYSYDNNDRYQIAQKPDPPTFKINLENLKYAMGEVAYDESAFEQHQKDVSKLLINLIEGFNKIDFPVELEIQSRNYRYGIEEIREGQLQIPMKAVFEFGGENSLVSKFAQTISNANDNGDLRFGRSGDDLYALLGMPVNSSQSSIAVSNLFQSLAVELEKFISFLQTISGDQDPLKMFGIMLTAAFERALGNRMIFDYHGFGIQNKMLIFPIIHKGSLNTGEDLSVYTDYAPLDQDIKMFWIKTHQLRKQIASGQHDESFRDAYRKLMKSDADEILSNFVKDPSEAPMLFRQELRELQEDLDELQWLSAGFEEAIKSTESKTKPWVGFAKDERRAMERTMLQSEIDFINNSVNNILEKISVYDTDSLVKLIEIHRRKKELKEKLEDDPNNKGIKDKINDLNIKANRIHAKSKKKPPKIEDLVKVTLLSSRIEVISDYLKAKRKYSTWEESDQYVYDLIGKFEDVDSLRELSPARVAELDDELNQLLPNSKELRKLTNVWKK